MKHFLTLLLLFIFLTLLQTNLGANSPKTLAILDFSNNSLVDKEKYASLSSGLAEIMITELSKIQDLRLIERQKINSLIQEMQLSQSGIISEATGVHVGKLLGAHYLVFGSFMVSFNNKIRIDIRIVEVETGVTVKAEQVTDSVKKIFDSIKKLNSKIAKDLNIKLSGEEKKAIKKGNTSLNVIADFSKGLEYEEHNKPEKARQIYEKILEADSDFEPAKKRLEILSSEK